jgi:hypothetical protein
MGNEPRNGVLVDVTERHRPFQRHRRRWEDNIKMDLKDIGWEGVKSNITKKNIYFISSTFELY